MLSFRQLSEKKTKIKINPKKDEIVEGQKKKKDDDGDEFGDEDLDDDDLLLLSAVFCFCCFLFC